MTSLLALATLLLVGAAMAKKGGKVDMSQIVNPDPDAEKIKSDEFNADLFEGDIKQKGGKGDDRNAVQGEHRLWRKGRVPFIYDSSLSDAMKQKVEEAIADYVRYTCIRFMPRTNERDYVRMNSRDSGCYAWLGRTGGQQPLNLADPGCAAKGTVIHEMLHTLGFAHEQSRNDRDKYIKINWNNIRETMHSQFEKLAPSDEDNQGFAYDYYSVMHYPEWGFSKNGRPSITALNPKFQKVIGQRGGFSKQDIEEVNKLYNCPDPNTSGGEETTGSGDCKDEDPEWCKQMFSSYGDKACDHFSVDDTCSLSCNAC